MSLKPVPNDLYSAPKSPAMSPALTFDYEDNTRNKKTGNNNTHMHLLVLYSALSVSLKQWLVSDFLNWSKPPMSMKLYD
jgi:hypothetical protein